MTGKLRIVDVERIVVDVPFTARCQEWNTREVWQWRISEVIRITTDVPDLVGYGETLPHYTWGRVSDEAIARVKGGNPADFLGDDSLGAGLQMALYDVVGKALGVPAYRLFNLPRIRAWCPISWWNIDLAPRPQPRRRGGAGAGLHGLQDQGAPPGGTSSEQVRAVVRATPSHFTLEMDWNQMLINAGSTTPVLTELDRTGRVAIYESPIMQRDVEGLRLSCEAKDHTSDRTTLRRSAIPDSGAGRGVRWLCHRRWRGKRAAAGALAAAFDKPFWLQMVGTGLTTSLPAPGSGAADGPMARGQLPEQLRRRPAGRAADDRGRVCTGAGGTRTGDRGR